MISVLQLNRWLMHLHEMWQVLVGVALALVGETDRDGCRC